jgi:hypothetical protein
MSFDQSEYIPDLTTLDELSLYTRGYVYVPSGCQNATAKCTFSILVCSFAIRSIRALISYERTYSLLNLPQRLQFLIEIGWLHVVFHGCEQTIPDIGSEFYNNTGFNTWAEANNIVIVYPQAKRSPLVPYNPDGCWDWYFL